MSYLTLEVDIDHGKILPSEPSQLPQKGKGLLTVLEAEKPVGKRTQLEALRELRRRLNLDEAKAKAWMDLIRDARR